MENERLGGFHLQLGTRGGWEHRRSQEVASNGLFSVLLTRGSSAGGRQEHSAAQEGFP